MSVIDDLLASLPQDPVALRDVRVGAFWTVVWTERGAMDGQGQAGPQRQAFAGPRRHGHRRRSPSMRR